MPQLKTIKCRLRVLMAGHEPPLTQTALTEATGLGSHTISRLVNNRFDRIDRSTIETLVDFFGCEIGDLLTLAS
ncbi:MAG: helix-turn-helix transcriptional regulator [Nodosilinea sp. LVE1205-7]|jgi:DNA-binding Xre family transcriptional regulator